MKAAPEKGRYGTVPECREMVPECHRGRNLQGIPGSCGSWPELADYSDRYGSWPEFAGHSRKLRAVAGSRLSERRCSKSGSGLAPFPEHVSEEGRFSGACGPWPEKVRAIPESCGPWPVWSEGAGCGPLRQGGNGNVVPERWTGKALPETWDRKRGTGNVPPEMFRRRPAGGKALPDVVPEMSAETCC